MQTIAIELAWVALLPILVVAVTMWLARHANAPPRAAWAASAGIAYVVGQVVLTGRTAFAPALWSSISPREAHDWLPLIVLAAAGISILAACAPTTWQRGIVVLAALLIVGTPFRLLGGNIAQHWSLGEKLAHLAILAAVLAIVWLLLVAADDNRQSLTRPFLMILVASASAAILVKSGTMLYGQLAGVIAATIAGAALVENFPVLSRFFRVREEKSGCPLRSGLGGAAGVIALALGSLLLLGHFYAELPTATTALLALSLVAAGGRLPDFMNRGPAWRQTVARTILCLIPLILAIAT